MLSLYTDLRNMRLRALNFSMKEKDKLLSLQHVSEKRTEL